MLNVFEILRGCLTPFLCLQLLKCVLRDLLEEKEVQKNLLQVHLNGTSLHQTSCCLCTI